MHEILRYAGVIKSTNATTPIPLTWPIECRPMGGRASGFPLYTYIQMTNFG